ncbi:TBC1 domain family member 30-like [Ornithodoros turicata]|uniref:TBC1 domain family member 30-like n=1 Tax=Ornithodoros turicata TaxID=34597 RepID=UPI0031399542
MCSFSSASRYVVRHGAETYGPAETMREMSRATAHRVSRTHSIVDELLDEIYDTLRSTERRRTSVDSDAGTESSLLSADDNVLLGNTELHRCSWFQLAQKEKRELRQLRVLLLDGVHRLNSHLVSLLRHRDRHRTRRQHNFDLVTAVLQAVSPKRSVDTRMRFSLEPSPGDTGFTQWRDAMKMVARLPGGIPPEFRKRLWLSLAERYLLSRKVDWELTQRLCFNDRSNPDDDNLGVQIVKDLHRTGCSLFSGEAAEQNQALLKRVLLAYARWNKSVGYCQGFNLLAAFVLEVVDWCDKNALKMMIYLVEGVLPEGYFANHLRGLSVDMAVFRDLLRLRLGSLARHLDRLQMDAHDTTTGTSYEPPLTNVFTMQWFLTLFTTCLPKTTVLRVWDLILLEGNEVLLRTALAIWDGLADRIMTVDSADEFYSIMGVLTREMVEFGLMDANELVHTICSMAPFPFPQLAELRDRYTYNIRPLPSALGARQAGQLRLFFGEDDDDADSDHQMVVATWCLSNALLPTKHKGQGNPQATSPDPSRMTLDISTLKRQYSKLKERQRQAHIILTGSFQSAPVPRNNPSQPVNHLLLGQKPLLRKNRPPPPTYVTPTSKHRCPSASATRPVRTEGSSKGLGETLSWEQVKKMRRKNGNGTENDDSSSYSSSSSSSTSTELCDDEVPSDANSSPEARRSAIAPTLSDRHSTTTSYTTASDNDETWDKMEMSKPKPCVAEPASTTRKENRTESPPSTVWTLERVRATPIPSTPPLNLPMYSYRERLESPKRTSSHSSASSVSSTDLPLKLPTKLPTKLLSSERTFSANTTSPSSSGSLVRSSLVNDPPHTTSVLAEDRSACSNSHQKATNALPAATTERTPPESFVSARFQPTVSVNAANSALPRERVPYTSEGPGSPPASPKKSDAFNPFPTARRASLTSYASEVGVKLGLYDRATTMTSTTGRAPSLRR